MGENTRPHSRDVFSSNSKKYVSGNAESVNSSIRQKKYMLKKKIQMQIYNTTVTCGSETLKNLINMFITIKKQLLKYVYRAE